MTVERKVQAVTAGNIRPCLLTQKLLMMNECRTIRIKSTVC